MNPEKYKKQIYKNILTVPPEIWKDFIPAHFREISYEGKQAFRFKNMGLHLDLKDLDKPSGDFWLWCGAYKNTIPTFFNEAVRTRMYKVFIEPKFQGTITHNTFHSNLNVNPYTFIVSNKKILRNYKTKYVRETKLTDAESEELLRISEALENIYDSRLFNDRHIIKQMLSLLTPSPPDYLLEKCLNESDKWKKSK